MDKDPHYKTGKMGRIARFLVTRRNGGDPYEETTILPALIITLALQLYSLQYFGDKVLLAVFIVNNIGAGIWIGICIGYSGTVRTILRGVYVSIIEAALLAALNDKLERSEAVNLAILLLTPNIMLFFFGHFLASAFREIALISEAQAQIGVLRRAKMYSIYRIIVGAEKIEGANDTIIIAVLFVKYVMPLIIIGFLGWTIFGTSPSTYLRNVAGLPK